jgi:hypothetical protein
MLVLHASAYLQDSRPKPLLKYKRGETPSEHGQIASPINNGGIWRNVSKRSKTGGGVAE